MSVKSGEDHDEYSLRLGDSLLESITRGLHSCDYGIVVLSPAFFSKQWTVNELAGLFALETKERKIILPIWHDVNREQVLAFNPILADRFAFPSTKPLDEIVFAIEAATWGGQRTREVGDPLRKEYAELESDLAIYDANEWLSHIVEGVMLVKQEVSHLLDVFLKRLDQVKGSMQIQVERRDQPVFNSAYFPAVSASGRFRVNIEIGYLNSTANATTRAKLVATLFAWPDDTPPQLAAGLGKKDELRQQVLAPRFTAKQEVQWINQDDQIIHTSEQVVEIALKLFKEEITARMANSQNQSY